MSTATGSRAGVAAVALSVSTWLLVTLGRLNAATGLLFLAAVFCALLWIVDRLPIRAARRPALLLLIATTWLSVSGGELALRIWLPRYRSYMEMSAGPNYSRVYRRRRSWYHLLPPKTVLHDRKFEYDYARPTNSLGLAEREIPVAKATDEYRVIALGDSFTEGLGAAPADGWVRVMERRLQERCAPRPITVINAGINGSAPGTNTSCSGTSCCPTARTSCS